VLFTGTWVWAAHMIGAIREFSKTGKGIVIWTHEGSQGWRSVGGLVLSAALNEVGIDHKFVYGSAKDMDVVKKVANFCKASALKKSMELTTLRAFGGRGMGQTCGVADPSQWMRTFGIDIDTRDTQELVEIAKGFDQKEVDKVCDWIDANFKTPVERNEGNFRSIRLYLALKYLKERDGFDYYTIQSFPGMGDYYAATCFAQSMMLNDGVPTSTLSDFNTALTSIMIMGLSKDPIYYGDLQNMDKAKKEIKIIGDGAVPPCLANEDGVRLAGHGIPTEGEAGGLSIDLVCKSGKGVLARVSRVKGEFQIVVARCDIVQPDPAELEARRHECGIPFWPHAFLRVHGDMEGMLENWNNEYGCLGYGEDLYDQIVDFGKLMGIKVLAF
jgi:L-fucose isomerase-like protein